MARAMGAYCSDPVPSFNAIGSIPMIVAREVIRMGRNRTRQAVITASETGKILLFQFVGEIDDQNAVRPGDANQHQQPHQRHDIKSGSGQRENHQDSNEAHGNGKHDEKRINERAELRHQDEVKKQRGEDKALSEALKRLFMPSTIPRKLLVHFPEPSCRPQCCLDCARQSGQDPPLWASHRRRQRAGSDSGRLQ